LVFKNDSSVSETTLCENIITLFRKEDDEYMIIFRGHELLYYYLPQCGRFQPITLKHLTPEIVIEDLGSPNTNGSICCVYAEIGDDSHGHYIYVTENECQLIRNHVKEEYEGHMYYDRITS
jgi:hypothetical protein